MAQADAIRNAASHVPPIDDSVKIPESVRRAAEKANSYYRTAPAPDAEGAPDATLQLAPAAPPSDQPIVPVQAQTPPEPPISPELITAQVQPAPVAPPLAPAAAPADLVPPEQWEHRYNSMKGRYDQAQQTIGAMQEQLQELGNELIRTQKVLNVQPGTQPVVPATPVVTDKDRTDYGDGIIDLVRRVASETVSPHLSLLEQENQRTRQALNQDRRQLMYSALDISVPNWDDINRRPEFKAWLRLRDIYSGEIRQQMLNKAFQAADAPRVANFFKGFIADEAATGNLAPVPPPPAPLQAPRQAAIPLETLTAPGRARPATGDTQVPVEKPIFTHRQIAWFYDQVRRGAYIGREQQKAVDEAAIFAAQNEGRIR